MIARMPLVASLDVLIVEGTVGGIHAAVELANAGFEVGLASRGTSLPYEIATCMHAWVPSELDSRPGLVAETLSRSVDSGEIRVGNAAEALEDILIDAGIRLFYDCRAVGALMQGDRPTGVVFGGTFGMVAVAASAIVDCTSDALIGRSAGLPVRRREASGRISYVCHRALEAADSNAEAGIDVVEGARGDAGFASSQSPTVELTQRGSYLEVSRSWDRAVDDPFWYASACVDLRRALTTECSTSRCGGLDRGADDHVFSPPYAVADGSPAVRVLGAAEEGSDDCAEGVAWDWGTALERAMEQTTELLRFAGHARDASSPDALAAGRYRLGLPDSGAATGEATGKSPGSAGYGAAGRSGGASAWARSAGSAEVLSATDHGYRERGSVEIEVAFPLLPTAETCDVLVAGGGTAGAVAATVAAERGFSVVCAEKHGDLGGANTTGGVAHYWFGRWSRYFRRRLRALNDVCEATGLPPSFAQLELAAAAGARLFFRTPTVGVLIVESDRARTVSGVLAIGADGPVVLRGATVIDSTGQGDIAAWAGADYTYGSERDEITLWCSFGAFHSGRIEASRQYLTVADQRSVGDLTRAIIAGRRQPGIFGEAEFPQHYLVTREARHIRGRERLRYVDALSDVDYQDSCLVCRSNVDIKGLAGSDAAFAGFVEQEFLHNYQAHVPFGAMVPVGLENVLVAGKAYSASHDAIALARMQADMITMGAVAGIAAGASRRLGRPVGELQFPELGEVLVAAGTIEKNETIPRSDHRGPGGLSDYDLELLCRRVSLGPVELDDRARILAHGKRAIPLLKTALESGLDRNAPAVAQLLCCLGDRTGSEILLRRLSALLEDGGLPRITHRRHIFPDHGFAPEPVYLVAALAQAGEPRLAAHLHEIVDRLELDPEVSDDRYTYVHAVAYAAERLATAEAAKAAERLRADPALRTRIIGSDSDPRDCADAVGERFAYLALSLCRAEARCGMLAGWLGLVDFLDDRRSFLFRSAWLELGNLSGVDLGYDAEAWRRALEESPAPDKSTAGIAQREIDWGRRRPLTIRYD